MDYETFVKVYGESVAGAYNKVTGIAFNSRYELVQALMNNAYLSANDASRITDRLYEGGMAVTAKHNYYQPKWHGDTHPSLTAAERNKGLK